MASVEAYYSTMYIMRRMTHCEIPSVLARESVTVVIILGRSTYVGISLIKRCCFHRNTRVFFLSLFLVFPSRDEDLPNPLFDRESRLSRAKPGPVSIVPSST